MTKTIFFPLWRGYSIRLLLKSESVSYLLEKGVRIVVLVPDAKEAGFWDDLKRDNVIVESLRFDELSKVFRTKGYSRLRLLRYLTYGLKLFQPQGTNKYHKIILWEKRPKSWTPRGLLKFSKDFIVYEGIKVASQILSLSKTLRQWVVKLEGELYSPRFHQELYEKYKPSLVVVPSTGYGVDPLIMREAQHFGAKVVSVIQSWDNPSSKGYGGCNTDYTVVWNDVNRREMIQMHDLSPERVFTMGVPHWDAYFGPEMESLERSAFFERYGLDPSKKTILFATSSPSLYHHNFKVAADILEKIQAGAYGTDCQLLMRVHPTYFMFERDGSPTKAYLSSQENMSELKKKFGNLVSFGIPKVKTNAKVWDIDQGDQMLLAEMLKFADVLVNVYSTMMIEASLFDLPIVNIAYGTYRGTKMPMSLYDEYEHIKPVNATGGVVNAYEAPAFHMAVRKYLADRALDREGRKRLADLMVPVNRGTAGRALGQFLAEAACATAAVSASVSEPRSGLAEPQRIS